MKHIKTIDQYVSEKYVVKNDESPQSITDKNSYNDTEFYIAQYNSRKSTLDTIYNNYTDRKDLISKLNAQGFINGTSEGRESEIRYPNPLLQLYSQIASANRAIKDTTDKTKEYNDQLNKIKSDNSGATNDETVKTQLATVNDSIKSLNDKTNELKQAITDTKKQLDEKMRDMVMSMQKTKSRIDARAQAEKQDNAKTNNSNQTPVDNNEAD